MTTAAVIGAGSIGTYIAHRLVQAGCAVVVCARSPVDNLAIDHGSGPVDVDAEIHTDPAAAEPVDWVFVTTKAYDNPTVGPWLDVLMASETTVVVVQNGLDQTAAFAALGSRVVAAIPYANVERVDAGSFVHRAGEDLVVPEGDIADRLAALFDATELQVKPTAGFKEAAWAKLLGNIAANPITVLTQARLGVLHRPRLTALARAVVAEGEAVARADGARLPEGTGEKIVELLLTYPPEGGTSMLFDRASGRRLEHEALTGAVVRRGRALGVPVPLNEAILALLDGLQEAAA